jgi:hypothetical protein
MGMKAECWEVFMPDYANCLARPQDIFPLDRFFYQTHSPDQSRKARTAQPAWQCPGFSAKCGPPFIIDYSLSIWLVGRPHQISGGADPNDPAPKMAFM